MSQQVPTHRITATKMADGRDLFYFDDSPGYVTGEKTRRLDDPRPLTDRFTPIENEDGTVTPIASPIMRLDQLTGEWIPMATHRMNRTFLPPASANPLAPADPDSEYQDGEIPATDYDVVVFENRFPSLLKVPDVDLALRHTDGEELFVEAAAAGRCEVICFSPNMNASLGTVTPRRMRTVIEAWTARTAELIKLPEVQEVFIFENRGVEIGVTLHHPHGQIYSYPYVTPRTEQLLTQVAKYKEKTGKILQEELLAAELRSGKRIVRQTDHWVAYVPVAGRWPIDLHIAPLRHVTNLTELTDAEKADLAELYLDVLQRADLIYPNEDGSPKRLPYISAWHQAPDVPGGEDTRLYLHFYSVMRGPGKLKYLAGSESGAGAWISDTTPEIIADMWRQVAK